MCKVCGMTELGFQNFGGAKSRQARRHRPLEQEAPANSLSPTTWTPLTVSYPVFPGMYIPHTKLKNCQTSKRLEVCRINSTDEHKSIASKITDSDVAHWACLPFTSLENKSYGDCCIAQLGY